MTSRRDDLVELFRSLTPLAFLLFCGHSLLRKMSRRCSIHYYYFLQQPLSEAPQAVATAERRGYSFSWYNAFSPDMLELPRPTERLRDRFSQRTVCLLVHRKSTLTSCAWFAFSHYEEDEARCLYLLPPGDQFVWDYDIYVDPAYRLSRAFSVTWQLSEAYLYERGYRHTLSRISAYNPGSLSSHEKLGARKIGAAVFFELWSLHLMLSSKQPFVHLSVSSERQPIIKFK